jgi:putative transposase
VQALLFERGMTLSHEAIRTWGRKVGQDYAHRLRRRRPQPGEKWYVDAVLLTMHGERHSLWRAVDQDDNVLDILVQRQRNKQAAKQFFRTVLQGLMYVPRVILTDRLQSYGAAKREITARGGTPSESLSQEPVCKLASADASTRVSPARGTSAGHAKRLLSAYGPMTQHCRPRRPLLSASDYRQEMRKRFESWAEVTGTERAASRVGRPEGVSRFAL